MAVQNRIGLLVENHMLKDYKTRVTATYELLHIVTGLLNREYAAVMDLNRMADQAVASFVAPTSTMRFGTMHFVVAVSNQAPLPLTRYARLIVEVTE